MKVPSIFTKQIKPSQWLGSAFTIYGASGFYQTIVNAFLLAATAYNTTLREWLPHWLNFWVFLMILIIGQLSIMLLHYKFVYPGIIAFSNVQGWKHDNPFRALQEKIDSKCDTILKLLENEKQKKKQEEKETK